MAATYYWYAWFAMIIVIFFIQIPRIRNRLVTFLLLIMITYSIYGFNSSSHLYIHVSLLIGYGIYLWLVHPKRIFQHFWPMILSTGYAGVQLFLAVHPVWLEFPGIHLSLIPIIYLLSKFEFNLESTIGLWIMINGGGALCSFFIFSFYGTKGAVVSEAIIILALKGLIIILLFHGISILKRSIKQQKRSSKKGAAYG